MARPGSLYTDQVSDSWGRRVFLDVVPGCVRLAIAGSSAVVELGPEVVRQLADALHYCAGIAAGDRQAPS